MKKSLYLIAGILIGITLFGGSSVLAAGITAERSTNRIYVNGQEVHLTAYNIMATTTLCCAMSARR